MKTLHHLALGAVDVDRVAGFYRDVLDLPECARHWDDDNQLRSIWLRLDHGVLMVEKIDRLEPHYHMRPGLFLLAVQIAPEERDAWEQRLRKAGAQIEERTDYTSYARDPEGNRVAVSFFPLEF